MKKEKFVVGHIPAILWGAPSQRGYLYIHGQSGNKEEAEFFAGLAVPRGYQVLSIDLPEHGERGGETGAFCPWRALPELKRIMAFAKEKWESAALYANSIGAWFGMLSLGEERLKKCLLVSPILDMARLIENMMQWAGVSEEELRERQTIETSFGQTLSWEYLCYARQHPITRWEKPTEILYAGKDHLTPREEALRFAGRFQCGLTVFEKGEHWFH